MRNGNYYDFDYVCVNCRYDENLQLHHIVPLILGGSNNRKNVVYLCEKCHGLVHGLNLNKHSKLTKKGIETARLEGKQIGRKIGSKLVTKKSVKAKEDILKYSKDFRGSLNDIEVMNLVGLARNTYYKYKRELIPENS